MTESKDRNWLVRATNQFARTVYNELRRAGHSKGDVLRFINELMDLLSRDAGQTNTVAPPALIEPEGGLPDRDTIQEVFEFELRRWNQDRRQERLAVILYDITIPSWTSGGAHKQVHDVMCEAVGAQLRRTDSLGRLGPDRYLIIAARAKDGVLPALLGRMQTLLDRLDQVLPAGLTLTVRSAECDAQTTSLVDIMERCFARPAVSMQPRTHAGLPAPEVRPKPVERVREVVLALGGGAARAASHAGVFKELHKTNVRVTGIAGCSAGGLVGAMSARGISPDEIIGRFESFTATTTYREMRRSYATFVREARSQDARSRNRTFGGTSMAFYSETALSAVSNELLHSFVEHFVGSDCDIRSLPVPFSVVATDLVEGRATVLSYGSLHAALAATCAVPGLFPPQRIGDRLLVDGSAVSELPVWAAQLLGVQAPVLAVYLTRPEHRVTDYHSSAEVATRSNALAHAELVREQLRHARYLISVPMHEIGWLDFRQAARVSILGGDAARESLPRILEQMEAREPQEREPVSPDR